ncbi:uncharacterized protein BO80DRAFT_278467 [Aspergillus ibericus CBS 121593]|uniref:Uncharacterized protein n=1 Tax=Aspergillus ibericus CBS 121593 TaxID=1448316 RepID=A0A395GI57_9EURO|nr:hypothetical protein BO80DRAFT_278467 [Aspergillus ibericus CBS 121593]RAK95131.1 hypothetical protein BO80DRAFT_278467 [Aspergillus ibericus CBS 121593]
MDEVEQCLVTGTVVYGRWVHACMVQPTGQSFDRSYLLLLPLVAGAPAMVDLRARSVLSGLCSWMGQRWDCALRFSHFLYGSSEGWSALRCFWSSCGMCAIVSDRLYLTTMKSRISLMRTLYIVVVFSPFLHPGPVGPGFCVSVLTVWASKIPWAIQDIKAWCMFVGAAIDLPVLRSGRGNEWVD